ncbi:MAG: choice-of-anchor D domain-containing protein, partial [Planctomycetes bacterium]|nr:choice-of-anchor D domain-containing protein [Planctomycetota bacterium]
IAVQGTGTPGANPYISLATDSMFFDTVHVGLSDTLYVTFYNDSGGPLVWDSTVTSSSDFNTMLDGTGTLYVGDSSKIKVIFTPTSDTTFTDSVMIYTNDTTNSPIIFYVEAVGIDTLGIPNIRLNPTSLNFDTVATGSTDSLTVWVANDSGGSLMLDSIAISMPEFWTSAGDSIPVNAGDSTQFTIYFNPASTDSLYLDSVYFYSNDSLNNPIALGIQGVGGPGGKPYLSVSLDTLSFDSLQAGFKDSLYITVYNDSGGVLNIDSVKHTSEFIVAPNTYPNITVGDSAIFTVYFEPTVDSTLTDSLYFFSNDTVLSPYMIYVNGIGIDTLGKPYLSVDTLSFNFDSVAVGDKDSLTLMVYNDSGGVLSLDSVSSASAEFWTSSVSSVNVIAGDSAEIIVYFNPATIDSSYSDSLYIFSNDTSSSPLALSVTGVGGTGANPYISFASDSMFFDSLHIGFTDTLKMVFYNDSGGPLVVDSIRTSISEFNAMLDGMGTLYAGDSSTVKVVFSPMMDSTFTDSVLIYSNDTTNNPIVFNLVGVAYDTLGLPNIRLNPTAWNFDTTAIDVTDSVYVWVVNDSGGAMTIDSIVFAFPEYWSSSVDPTPILAGDSTQYTIYFNPATIDSFYSDMAEFYSNDTLNNPKNFLLQGVGGPPGGKPYISISAADTLDFDSVSIGITDSMVIYVYNDSGGTLDVDSVLYSGAFSAAPDSFIGINAGDSAAFTIYFTPTNDTTYFDSLYFYSNDTTDTPVLMYVQGVGQGLLNKSIAINYGNWSSGSTWQGGSVPSPGDTIVISDSVDVTFDAGALDTTYSELIYQPDGNTCQLTISSLGLGGSGVKFEHVRFDTMFSTLEVQTGTSIKFDSLYIPPSTQFTLRGDGTFTHGAIDAYGELSLQGGNSTVLDSAKMYDGSKIAVYAIDRTIHKLNVFGDITIQYVNAGSKTSLIVDSLSLVSDTLRIESFNTDTTSIQSGTPINLGTGSLIDIVDSSLAVSAINLTGDARINLGSQTLYVDSLVLNTKILTLSGPGKIDNTTAVKIGGAPSALVIENGSVELNNVLINSANGQINVNDSTIVDNMYFTANGTISFTAGEILEADSVLFLGNTVTATNAGTLKTTVPVRLDSISSLWMSGAVVEKMVFADTNATLVLNDTSTIRNLIVDGGGQLSLGNYTLKTDSIYISNSKLMITNSGRIDNQYHINLDTMGILQIDAAGEINSVAFLDTTATLSLSALDTVYNIFSYGGGKIELNSYQLWVDTLLIEDSRLRIEGTAGGAVYGFGPMVMIDSAGVLDLSNSISVPSIEFMGKDAKLKVDSLSLVSDLRILKDSYIEIGTGFRLNNAWFSNSGASAPTTVSFQGTGGFYFGQNMIQLGQDMTLIPNTITFDVSGIDSITASSSATFDPGTDLDLSNLISIGGEDTSKTLTLQGDSQRVFTFGGYTHLSGDLTLAGRDSMHLTVDSALVMGDLAGTPYVFTIQDTASIIADSILGLIESTGSLVLNTEGIVQLYPTIVLDTVSIAFDSTFIGYSDTIKVWVINDGTAALDIDSVGGPGEFSTLPTDTSGIAAGDSIEFSILFSPAADSTYSDTLRFYSNDPNKLYAKLAVDGIGVTPYSMIVFDTLTYDFDTVNVGSTDSIEVWIYNQGYDSLNVDSVAAPGYFWVEPDTIIGLQPGDSALVTIFYAPLTPEIVSDSIIFYNNDPGVLQAVFNIQAVGYEPLGHITFLPDTVLFDTVFTIASDTIDFWVRNDGDDSLFIDSVAVPLDSSFYVTFSDTLMAIGDSVQFSVVFAPDSDTTYVDTLIFWSSDSLNYPAKLIVMGTGEIAFPMISFDTLIYDFDTVNVNTTDSFAVWIYNDGDDSLNVDSVVTPTNMWVSPDSIIGLQPNDSSMIWVYYGPLGPAAMSDSLTFYNNDPGLSQAVYNVTATAYQPLGVITFIPDTVDYPDTVFAFSTDTFDFFVRNDGDDSLVVDSIVVPALFSITPFDSVIQVGDSVEYSLVFSPTGDTTLVDTLIFINSDSLNNPA